MTDDRDPDARAAALRQRIASMKAETEALAAQSAAIQGRIIALCAAIFDERIPLADLQAAVDPALSDEAQAAALVALVEGARR